MHTLHTNTHETTRRCIRDSSARILQAHENRPRQSACGAQGPILCQDPCAQPLRQPSRTPKHAGCGYAEFRGAYPSGSGRRRARMNWRATRRTTTLKARRRRRRMTMTMTMTMMRTGVGAATQGRMTGRRRARARTKRTRRRARKTKRTREARRPRAARSRLGTPMSPSVQSRCAHLLPVHETRGPLLCMLIPQLHTLTLKA